MTTPTFSIIIPVYNVAPYLRETLDSVLLQSYTHFELICVDDGSPDESGAIIDEYAERDGRIKAVHKKNGGVSSARNAGIEVANGEWLLFLDGDDLLAKDTLDLLYSSFKTYPSVDLFRFGFVEFENTVKYDRASCFSPKLTDIANEIAFKDIFVYMWQFAYRRSMVGDLRFNLTYRRMEDRPFVCNCLLNRNNKFVDIGYTCLGYRQRANSAMHSVPSAYVWDGEIRYRVELIKMLYSSGKKCDGFVTSSWIGGFFGWRCLRGILPQPVNEREQLMKEWQNAICFMRTCREFSYWLRIKYMLCQFSNASVFHALVLSPTDYFRYYFMPLQPLFKLYRKLLHHGEFADN